MQAVAADARAIAERPAPQLTIRWLRVSFGEETVQPAPYSSIRYGGLEAEVEVPPGADAREVYRRTYALLSELAGDQYRQKLEAFYLRIKNSRVPA